MYKKFKDPPRAAKEYYMTYKFINIEIWSWSWHWIELNIEFEVRFQFLRKIIRRIKREEINRKKNI